MLHPGQARLTSKAWGKLPAWPGCFPLLREHNLMEHNLMKDNLMEDNLMEDNLTEDNG